MKSPTRPTPITTLLQTLESALRTDLEAYIADLEAKQPIRPARIAEILQLMDSQSTSASVPLLEASLMELEVKQQYQIPVVPTWDPQNPPVWSQQRTRERELRRQERALKKQNHYQ
jgi:hypothetical protein